MPTIATKTYSCTNGTANDATGLNSELAVLFNNDDVINTALSTLLSSASFATATTLTMNANHVAAPSSNVKFEVERGSAANVSLRWNETDDVWQYTNDGTNYYNIGPLVLSADPTPTPTEGQFWANTTEHTPRFYNGAVSKTLGGYAGVRATTGTSESIGTGDRDFLVTFNNASPVAASIAQAGSTGFKHKFSCFVMNLGDGVVTVTPATSTINGAPTITLNKGDGFQILSNDTNYFAPIGRQVVTPFSKSYTSAELTIASQGTGTLTHGLSAIPKLVVASLICKTSEYGYNVGDIVPIANHHISSGSSNYYGIGLSLTSSSIVYQLGNQSPPLYVYQITGTPGSPGAITLANWKLIITAYA